MTVGAHTIHLVVGTRGENEDSYTYNLCWRPSAEDAEAVVKVLVEQEADFQRWLAGWMIEHPAPEWSATENADYRADLAVWYARLHEAVDIFNQGKLDLHSYEDGEIAYHVQPVSDEVVGLRSIS